MTASQDPARRPEAPEPGAPRDPAAALDFGDPLSRPSADDTDHGWGGSSSATTGDAAADLARFLDEKPPHHL
ncbi:hypothetical protein [Streptomyces sp. JJ38]|uniref:hypothetical protein n=1 Tax=Streptomyces sp. JJ38 TaxID=2738128 RepID=UPI001C56D2F8|nr:hypothetical protein [Streptomyces sp. JJ38]MBW1597705.1 hypothetical protein [Streptomyces sp. JJ38]